MPDELDKYGNRADGNGPLTNCCYPDCGCDGARVCMAKSGPNDASMAVNLERRSPKPLT